MLKGTVIQGFISPGRIKKYFPDMKRGSVYKLDNFYGSRNKTMYPVADHIAILSFSWNSELSILHEIPIPFDEDRFRFHSHEDFQANCDLKGDLYDVVGHMKLGNGQTLSEHPNLEEVEIATTRHLLVHVQSYEHPCADLYVLHTLGSNPEIAKKVSAEVVTKRETLTIAEIFSYIKQESAKDAFFECTATIDDVVHGSSWYYIACSGCHTKATKGLTSLMCSKCGKVNIAVVAQYRAKISVYNNSDQAVFVLLGDAGHTPPPAEASVGNQIAATSEEILQTGNDVCGPSKSLGDSDDEKVKRTCDSDNPEKAKRPRCGT
ncbi:hypothetical protein Bca52824_016447 [Brassica carinata]|uniref:Replication factor A C-terminal domain-containing protein n=1 Tax=Brassica carinata TaxID=52824 RepID=A0A8X7W3N4_BRACI|nr:hypothetical protein Bca52824_016447 [Brassica carinata]